MGNARNLIPTEILRDPQRMQSLQAYLLGAEAESSVRLDGETFTPDPRSLAWMFDIDGTLTVPWKNGTPGKRDWYDYASASDDLEHFATVELALSLKRVEIPLIFLTARPERFAGVTLGWLRNRYLVDRHVKDEDVPLFMRPDGDEDVPDPLVKQAVYKSLIEPRWAVRGVFEDNPQCIQGWLEEGLAVFEPHHRKDPK